MNSVFASALRPAPVGFALGLLLVVATAFPTAPSVSMKEEPQGGATSDKPFTPVKTESTISYILMKISDIRKKMCNYDANCLDCKQVLSDVNLTLPQLTERDGCFPSAPNQEICLMRITAGLLEFEIYLKHLQNKFKSDEENNNMDIVLQNSQTLVKTLRPKVKTTEEAPTLEAATLTSLKENMQLKEQWRRTQTIHYILCGLKDFLEFTLRAVRLM